MKLIYIFFTSVIILFLFSTGCGTNCISMDELSKEYDLTIEKINKFKEDKRASKFLVDTLNNIRVVNKNPFGADRIIYFGDSKESIANGFGKLFWLRGLDTVELYEGNFKDGIYHGRGKRELNSRILLGTWENGLQTGEISIKFRDGRKYKGKHLDSLVTYGRFDYPNGDYYMGVSKEYFRDSLGTYYFKNGDKYIGIYAYDKRNEEGKYFYSNGDSVEMFYENGNAIKSQKNDMQLEESSLYIENIKIDIDKFRKSVRYPCVLSKFSNLGPQYRIHALVVFHCNQQIEFLGFKEKNIPEFVEKSVLNALYNAQFSPGKLDVIECDIYTSVPFVFNIE